MIFIALKVVLVVLDGMRKRDVVRGRYSNWTASPKRCLQWICGEQLLAVSLGALSTVLPIKD